ncbi:MAG: pilus assembly protein N-terminal domain-containing protein [Pirellulales bacterium]
MVLNRLKHDRCLRAAAALIVVFLCLSSLADEVAAPPPVAQKITAANTKIELAVNGSRILKLESPIPRAKVDNPELLAFTVLSENEVQIHAKKAGITTVYLWDDHGEVHTIDVVITGDVRELAGLLKTQFPTASIKLYPTQASTLIVYGYVDRADYVNTIMRIAEDYYPKVINNMIVGGTQQVLLHVKVMEVSRTNLKALGFDFANFSGSNFFGSAASGILAKSDPTASVFRSAANLTTSGAEILQWGIVSDPSGFVGFLEALKRENLLKVLAEPNLVTVSGRPASYLVGGELPYPQPTGFGNISINFKPFGTQIDFVPIVLGNGSVRLEVRPQVSEPDPAQGITIAGTTVPAFRTRMVDTGVEMKFGQTLAIAGLLQQRVDNEKRGVPYLMDLPYVGAAFRRIRTTVNEVELLVMVRPELVEAMDPDQVPTCLPGMNSQSPDDCGLYWKGYIETPVRPYGPQGHGPDGHGGPGSNESFGPAPEQVIPTPAPATDPTPTTRVGVRSKQSVVVSDGPQTAPASAASSRRPAYAHRPPWESNRSSSYSPSKPQTRKTAGQTNTVSDPPGFIGPIGYDVKN